MLSPPGGLMNRLMLVCLFATIALSSWAQDHVINAPNFTLRLKQAADHQTLSLSGNFAAGDYNSMARSEC